jgi:hypothetical protein
MLSALTLFVAFGPAAHALCPADVAIHGALTCSSSYSGTVDHTEDSYP